MVTQLRAIGKHVKLGYFLLPHSVLICLWFLPALSSTDHSVSQKSLGSPHDTLATRFGTLAGCWACAPRQEVEFFLSLPWLFSIPSLALKSNHDSICTVLLSLGLLWHLYMMFRTGGCLSWSFILSWWQIPEAVPPAQQRNQLDCGQLTHGWDKAPGVSLQTWFIGQKHIQIYLEEMAWNMWLNKWAELQRVESFPCKWWAFRHRSKVLGNQWESFQWSSRYFQRESYWLWQGCRSTVGPGPPRLWEEGANTDGSWDRRPHFVAWSCQISGLNEQFTISAENHYSEVFNASHSLPWTWYLRFIANCFLPAFAKPSVFFGLGHPSSSVVFLSLTWWICKQAPGKRGPKYESSCRWLSHSCQYFSHNSNTKLQAVGRGKLLNWWEDMIETDPLIHFHFQKICCHIHPRWGKPTQATHAWSACGPEVLISHSSHLLVPTPFGSWRCSDWSWCNKF